MVSRAQEWTAVVLTATAGIVALVVALLFRNQLPVPRVAARVTGFCLLYGGMALFLWSTWHLGRAVGGRVAPVLDHFVVTGPYRFVRHLMSVRKPASRYQAGSPSRFSDREPTTIPRHSRSPGSPEGSHE